MIYTTVKNLSLFFAKNICIWDLRLLPLAFCIKIFFKQNKTILLGPTTMKNFSDPGDESFGSKYALCPEINIVSVRSLTSLSSE